MAFLSMQVKIDLLGMFYVTFFINTPSYDLHPDK